MSFKIAQGLGALEGMQRTSSQMKDLHLLEKALQSLFTVQILLNIAVPSTVLKKSIHPLSLRHICKLCESTQG